jgi:hypothetical protein
MFLKYVILILANISPDSPTEYDTEMCIKYVDYGTVLQLNLNR